MDLSLTLSAIVFSFLYMPNTRAYDAPCMEQARPLAGCLAGWWEPVEADQCCCAAQHRPTGVLQGGSSTPSHLSQPQCSVGTSNPITPTHSPTLQHKQEFNQRMTWTQASLDKEVAARNREILDMRRYAERMAVQRQVHWWRERGRGNPGRPLAAGHCSDGWAGLTSLDTSACLLTICLAPSAHNRPAALQ